MAEEVAVLAATTLALAAAAWLALRLRLPPALGYLAVGLIASPAVRSTPSLPVEPLHFAAELAVLVLVFFIGLELDFQRLLATLRTTAFAAAFNILIPGLLAAAAAHALGWGYLHAIVLGICVSVSSTIFGERLAATRGFPGEARRRLLGILVGEDVAAVALLAVLVVLGEGEGSAAVGAVARLLILLPLIMAAALLIIPRVLDAAARTHDAGLLVLATAATIVVFALLGNYAGSAELGALAAGVACAEAAGRFTIRHALEGIRSIALAVFFLASGVFVDPLQVLSQWGTVLLVACVFLVGKIVVNVPSAMAAGFNVADGWRIGIGLATIGEFSLILAAAATTGGVAHTALSTTVVGALLVSLVLAPILLKAAPRVANAAQRSPPSLRRPLLMVLSLMRRSKKDAPAGRGAGRQIAANALPLFFIVASAAAWADSLAGRLPLPVGVGVMLVWGVALAVSAPFAVRGYLAYRDLVRSHLHRVPTNIPDRITNAVVAVTGALLLAPLGFLFPRILPVVVGGILVAVILSVLAWRRLASFQAAIEATVARVLGKDAQQAALLDAVVEKYPWGVRFAAVAVPADSPVAGRSLREGRLPDLTGAEVAVVQRGGAEVVNPGPDFTIQAGDTVVLMGEAHQLNRAEAIVVAREGIRLAALSSAATIEEVPVLEGSPWTNRSLAEAKIREETGALVVGLLRGGQAHPTRYRPDLVVVPGDTLILLGTPLQMQRARALASPR